MNKAAVAVLSFILGAGAGTGVTYIYIKNKYQQTVRDEIEAFKKENGVAEPVRQDCEKPEETEADVKKQEAERARNKPDINEYAKTLRESGYHRNYSDAPVENNKSIFIEYIKPEEFANDDSYDIVSLTYYSDNVLCDDKDEKVDDAFDIVGNFEKHFGEFEDDSVYVRNDDRETYYEILKDNRRYIDVISEE